MSKYKNYLRILLPLVFIITILLVFSFTKSNQLNTTKTRDFKVVCTTNIIEESFFAEHDIIHYDEDNTEGIKIGSIKIFFTRYYLNSSLNDDLLRFLMSGFILISFLIIFMVFLITRFTSPLISLTGIMKERLSGNYESKVNKLFAKREDEIGQISKIMIKESVLRTNEKLRVKFVEKLTSGWALDRLLNELIFDFKNIMNCERVSIFIYNAIKK